MSRPPKHAEDIGPALVDARAEGVPWKTLAHRFDMSRVRLWQLWRAALDATEAAWPGMER